MEKLSEEYKMEFMSQKPTLYDTMRNNLNQEIKFFEHPENGDEDFVYALIDDKVLVRTDFFETEDMMQDHQEYTPFLIDGLIYSGFELF
ncbi:hypothetical protein EON73_05595 [bacterium]|nr:MAG: hypothetical protein EON73_05595 [bacterium]